MVHKAVVLFDHDHLELMKKEPAEFVRRLELALLTHKRLGGSVSVGGATVASVVWSGHMDETPVLAIEDFSAVERRATEKKECNMKLDYSLVGSHPAVERLDLEQTMADFAAVTDMLEKRRLAGAIELAAEHFYGLTLKGAGSIEALIDAIKSMEEELAVH